LKEFEVKEDDINSNGNQDQQEEDFFDDLFFDSEDSEIERTLNTTGNAPKEWYEDHDHIGYDLEGNKIRKIPGEDAIDKFLGQQDNPWSVIDPETGQRVSIKDQIKDLDKIRKGVESERYAPEKWFVQLDEYSNPQFPLSSRPEPKTRFIPSRWEAKRIRKYAYAYKMGWLTDEKPKKKSNDFFLIWDDDQALKERRNALEHIPAPKMKLPSNAESYNPPVEYLLDEEEKKTWELLDPEERPENFIPKKYNSLRETPAYDRIQDERFQRCLDLYLATRAKVKRIRIDPKTLLPKLPKPSELKPYPSQESMIYEGHEGAVTCIDVDPTGQYIVSGSEDKTVRIWEVSTGRQMAVWDVKEEVCSLNWNPNPDVNIIAIVIPKIVMFLCPDVISTNAQKEHNEKLFSQPPGNNHKEKIANFIEWVKPEPEYWDQGYKLFIQYKSSEVKFVSWHKKGDYITSISPNANTRAILIHQISKQQTQNPFTKSKGIIQCAHFHPSKPLFFVATQKHIRIYNLLEQKLEKKLLTGAKMISGFDIHPSGDDLIMSSYDYRVCWFDLDMDNKPYKILKYHKGAVRNSKYHRKYPLFASCSDDGSVHIFHGMVYNNLLQNPFIVPLKILKGHEIVNERGVFDIVFHPNQPWIFSAGADKTIRLFT